MSSLNTVFKVWSAILISLRLIRFLGFTNLSVAGGAKPLGLGITMKVGTGIVFQSCSDSGTKKLVVMACVLNGTHTYVFPSSIFSDINSNAAATMLIQSASSHRSGSS